MTRLINGRTPEQYSAWNRWHAIIAALLALLLLILWFSGKGPGFATASGSCCSTATPVAATPVAPAAEPVAAAPVDTDGDGVTDDLDVCPGTPAGTVVDARGCDVAVAAEPAVAPIPAANLYFDVDKFEAPSDTDTKLLPIVEYLKANPSAVAVISGYHDPTGDAAHNEELARKRATAVKDAMTAAGVPDSQIEMVKPVVTTGSGDMAEARRVEVAIRR